jgi:hypothetical protein
VNRLAIIAAFAELSVYRRIEAMRVACGDALEVWRRYRKDGVPLDYRDGVVGEHHTVDDLLPVRALAEVDRYLGGDHVDPAQTDKDYSEPIVAMQDDDLDLPGPVAQAYYAIYNLHRIAFRFRHAPADDVVLSQVASAVDVELDDWVKEWWTRVWDAWASLPELAYAPSPLAEPVWRALCAGDLEGAVAATAGEPSLVRAVVLGLAGRREQAIETAMAAIGSTSDEVHAWLVAHVCALLPEAIAIAADSTKFAVISGDRLEVRETRTGASVRATSFPGSLLRFVRFRPDGTVVVGGERVDQVGAWATFWDAGGEVREVRGRREIVAFGGEVFVPRHATDLIALGANHRVRIEEMAVLGAAIADDGTVVAAFAADQLALWQREYQVFRKVAGAVRRIGYAGDRLLVMWKAGGAAVYDVSA